MSITREQFLTRKLLTETVPCPELGPDVSVLIRRLTSREYLTLADAVKADPKIAFAHWVVACVRDENDQPVFTPQDAAALADTDFVLINRLAEVALRLNGAAEGQAAKNS